MFTYPFYLALKLKKMHGLAKCPSFDAKFHRLMQFVDTPQCLPQKLICIFIHLKHDGGDDEAQSLLE